MEQDQPQWITSELQLFLLFVCATAHVLSVARKSCAMLYARERERKEALAAEATCNSLIHVSLLFQIIHFTFMLHNSILYLVVK